MRKAFMIVLLLIAPSSFAQTQIDPAAQIYWPKVSGSGAPSSSCSAGNYGQPYVDTSSGTQYSCAVGGWKRPPSPTTQYLALNAVGDCGMDNTGSVPIDSALVACIAMLPAAGGEIYFPALSTGTTYLTTAPVITTTKSVKLIGAGVSSQQGTPGATIFQSVCSAGGDVLEFSPSIVNQTGPEIDNIEFVDVSGTGACRSGLHVQQTNDVVLDGVSLQNFLGKTWTGTVSFTAGSNVVTGSGFTAAMAPGMIQIAGINYEIGSYISASQVNLVGTYYGSATSPASAVIHWNGAGLLVDGETDFSQYWSITRLNAQNVRYPYRTVGSSSSAVGTSANRIDSGFINCNRLPDSIGVWLGGFSDTTYPSLSINNCSVGVAMENAHANDIHGLRLENNGTASVVTTCNGGTASYSCINGVIVGGSTPSNTYGNNLGGALIVNQGTAILLGSNALHTIVGPNSYRSNTTNVTDNGASTSLYDDVAAKLPGSIAWGGGSAIPSSNSIVALSNPNVFTANQEIGAQGTAVSGTNYPSYQWLFQSSVWNGTSATTCGAPLSVGPGTGTSATIAWTFGTCAGQTFSMNMGNLTGMTFPANTFKVNTVANASQNGLNVNNGSGTTASNPTYGNIQIDDARPVALSCTSGSPTFSAVASVQSCTLSQNITAPTIPAGLDGFCTTFILQQGASTAYTLAWPSNVSGGGTVSATLGGYNSQSFCYSSTASLWISANSMGGSGGGGTSVANITNTTSVSSIPANSCDSSAGTASMPGLTTSMTLTPTPSTDISATTGWGDGTIYFVQWPTAGQLNYKRCNSSSSAVAPTEVLWIWSAK